MHEIDISQIIRCAQRTPSGDNSQPFHFVYKNETLFVYYNPKIGNHILNFRNTVSIITLGCIMELIEISASNQSFLVHWTLFDFHVENDGVVAEATFSKNDNLSKDPLYPFIFNRICDREVYIKETLSPDVLEAIKAEALRFPALHSNITSDFSKKLMEYIKTSELTIWEKPLVIKDIFKWVRFTQKSYIKYSSGLYWKDLGAKIFEFPVLLLIRFFPWVPRFLIHIGFGFVFKDVVSRNVKSSSGLLLVSGSVSDKMTLENVGRFVMRSWLSLTKHGYVMQPLSIQSISIYWISSKTYFTNLTPKNEKLFKSGELLLKKLFEVPNELGPVWLLRIGKPKNPKTPSLRKPLSTIFLNQDS